MQGGTVVEELSVCTILILDEETAANDIARARELKCPVFTNKWLDSVFSSKSRELPVHKHPPEISLHDISVDMEVSLQNKHKYDIEQEGCLIVNQSTNSQPTRRFTPLVVDNIPEISISRNIICFLKTVAGNHLPTCDVTHFMVSFTKYRDLRSVF